MKLVLTADVDTLGLRGDVVDVSDGYARNYLVPRGHAIVATKGIEAQATAMRRSRDVKDTQARQAAEAVARQLVAATVLVSAKAGAEGRLFGSITTSDIVAAVTSQWGVDLDRRRIHLAEPIRSVGLHEVPVRLHSDVEFTLTVEVVAG